MATTCPSFSCFSLLSNRQPDTQGQCAKRVLVNAGGLRVGPFSWFGFLHQALASYPSKEFSSIIRALWPPIRPDFVTVFPPGWDPESLASVGGCPELSATRVGGGSRTG